MATPRSATHVQVEQMLADFEKRKAEAEDAESVSSVNPQVMFH
jgi:hypothetical protein